MHSGWFRSTFLRVWKFLQIKKVNLISGMKRIWRKSEVSGNHFCISILKVLRTHILCHSLDQCILHDSGVLFSVSWNFYKLKNGDLISGGNQFRRKSELFCPHFCIWIFKNLGTEILCQSLHQCVPNDSGVLFSESWNFYKLKDGDLISGLNQFRRKSELFGQPFCSSILKVLMTQILGHSLDFHSFSMIQDNFSQNLEISTN